MEPITIRPKSPRTRWVALGVNNEILVEGIKPQTVHKKAEKLGVIYFLMWVPRPNVTYFF